MAARACILMLVVCLLAWSQPWACASVGDDAAWEEERRTYAALKEWVIRNGGMVRADIGRRHDGLRGLFTSEAIKKGEHIADITGESILNLGSSTHHFFTSMLTILREVKDPHSRFKPYIDHLPKKDGVLNACNLPKEYWPLLTPGLEAEVNERQAYLPYGMTAASAEEMEYTLPEMVGTANVTLDDVKYACAIATSRYVSTSGTARNRLLLVPIYDLGNHERYCSTIIEGYINSNVFSMVAGEDLPAGAEICNSYGHHVTDDHAFSSYGFLPTEEIPNRMFAEDRHPSLKGPDDAFQGTDAEIDIEIGRLEAIQHKMIKEEELRAGHMKKDRGVDSIYDMIMELHERRKRSLEAEIRRLKKLRRNQTAKGGGMKAKFVEAKAAEAVGYEREL